MSTLTARGLFRKAALSDAADIALAVPQLGDDIDAKAFLWGAGVTGAMPASAIDGRLYHDTTLDRILYDTGTTWRKLLYQTASGEYVADSIVNATGFKVSSVSLAASHLSNGTTGTGSVVLAAAPTLTGVPLAPTAAPGTNTTQIATTAYVLAASPGTGSITSAMIVDGTIVNADVSGAAGITYGKLNLSGSIVAGDLASDSVSTAKIQAGAVTPAKMSVKVAGGVTAWAIADDAGSVDFAIDYSAAGFTSPPGVAGMVKDIEDARLNFELVACTTTGATIRIGSASDPNDGNFHWVAVGP